MKGSIIVNGFIKWDKFDILYEMITSAFLRCGVKLSVVSSLDMMSAFDGDESGQELISFKNANDFVLFWDKDYVLAKRLEDLGMRVFNSAEAIRICDDKALTAQALIGKGIRMPKTIVSPYSFRAFSNIDFLDYVIEQLKFPFVLKKASGSFGAQVHLIENKDDLIEKVNLYNPQRMVFQELIKNSFGRDVRIHVVGGKVVASVLRIAKEGELCANVTNGGSMHLFTPSQKMQEMCIKVTELLGVDFAGVDILFDADEPVLCEVNTNAHFKNLFDATKVNVADFIAEYVISSVRNSNLSK